MKLVINDFPGIAPGKRQAEPGAVTYAATAENVDLVGKSLRPVRDDSFVESGHTSEIAKFKGAYISGLEDPIVWKKSDLDVLIYKDGGNWYKKVETQVATLGLPQASELVLEDIALQAPSNISPAITATIVSGEESNLPATTMGYYISWIIVRNGKEYEGDLSAAIEVSAPESEGSTKNTILRPGTPPTGVSRWRIYRSDDGDEARLITTVEAYGLAGASYTDTHSTYNRGISASEYIAQGSDQYTFSYFVTWERTVGGWIEESGPSPITSISQRNVGVRIKRPLSVPAGVTNWKIYRISTDFNPTTTFQLVAIVPTETSTYEDYLYNENLGSAPLTYYTDDAGNIVSYRAPPVSFTGMVGPFFGVFFAWKGSKLYLSEPGQPDAWPESWEFDAYGDIKAIVQNGSEVMVFTSSGAQRGIGGTPESFYLSPGIIGESCLNKQCAVSTQDGVWYLSRNGLNRVYQDEIRLVTTEILGREYFLGMDESTSKMFFYNSYLLISYDDSTLIFDISNNKYTTLDRYIASAWWDREEGYLAILDETTIKGWKRGAGYQTVNYKTGEITLASPDIKSYPTIRFHGEGEALVILYIDGTETTRRVVDMDGMRRDREIKTKADTLGRELSIQIQGSLGEVKEIEIEVFEKATL